MLEELYLRSSGSAPRLRIGVMLDGVSLSSTLVAVLDHIRASNFAEIALIVRNAAATAGRRTRQRTAIRAPEAARARAPLRSLLYRQYERWDMARHSEVAAAIGDENCERQIAGVEELWVTPISSGCVDRFPDQDVAACRAHKLDVMLQFGFNTLGGDILGAARYGIWSYFYGDIESYRGGPPGFWELVERAPVSGVTLQLLSDNPDGGLVLAKSLSPTQLGVSRAANMLGPCRSGEPLVIWKLHQLHMYGWESVKATALPHAPYRGRRAEYRLPRSGELLSFLLREGVRKAARAVRRDRRVRKWQIAVRRASDVAPWEGSWDTFRWLPAPRGHFLADPFLVDWQGRTWLFAEDFDYRIGRGVISCCELHADGSLGEWRVALARPYHLSFPHVFSQDGETYMIPESAAAGSVDLFRAVEFPYRWELDCTLWNKPARDTILHVGADGNHYFITSLQHAAYAQSQLFIFNARRLREKWEVHPASPISLDARYARNGGPIARHGQSLVRVSQDLTLWYGRQMHFHRIDALTPTEYRETLVGTRAADWEMKRSGEFVGTHSYGRLNGWEVTDGIQLIDPGRS